MPAIFAAFGSCVQNNFDIHICVFLFAINLQNIICKYSQISAKNANNKEEII